MRLTPDERGLIALHRAFVAYVHERTRLDATLDEPRAESYEIRLYPDTSGRLIVEPDDVNERAFDAAVWPTLDAAAGIVDAARVDLETARRERETYRARRFGDPRKGRRKDAPTRGWWSASADEHAADEVAQHADCHPAAQWLCGCPACKVARAVGYVPAALRGKKVGS